MPNLVHGGITFVLTDDWLDTTNPPGPNGYPLNADGAALNAILASLFSATESSAFLAQLSGQTIYVIAGAADQRGIVQDNAAMYPSSLIRSIGWPGGVVPTDSLAKRSAHALLTASTVGGSAIPSTANSFLFIGKDILPNSTSPISTPNSTSTIDGKRIIFHELAHAVTLNSTAALNGFLNSASRQFHFEDIAIAAENYIYRKDFGGPVRVGHNSSSVPSSTFDPTLPFNGDSAPVKYVRGSDGDAQAHAFFQFRASAGVTIIKTYHSDGFAPGAHGKYNNYVTVQSIGTSALLVEDAQGTITKSPALNSVISGIAAEDAAGKIDKAVRGRDSVKDGAGVLLSWASIQSTVSLSGVEWLTKVSKFKLDDIYNSKGLTNEVSVSDALVVGPQVADAANAAKYLDITTQLGSVLLGASGFNQKSVDFRDKVDAIQGSDQKDLILAGSGFIGTPTGASRILNEIDAKGGDDLVVAGTRDDKVLAGDGDDIVVAGKGIDIIEGQSGRDVLVVGDDLRRAVVEVNSNGTAEITAGSGNKSYTTGFEMFVGGANRVTFRQVADMNGASPALFVAGSGGADFYLESGGVAVGNDAAVDNFYLSDGLPQGFTGDREAYLRSNQCVLVNVDANDKIFVRNKAGAWVQFTGAQATSTLLPKLILGTPSSTDTAGGGVQLSGASAYEIEYAQLSASTFEGRYVLPEESRQRTVNYIPLDIVSSAFGVINFSDYTQDDEGLTLNNYLNVIIDFDPSSAGLNFTRDSMSPILPFEYAPTFWDAHGYNLYFSGEYGVGVEYEDYRSYNLTAGDWDWFKRDEQAFMPDAYPPVDIAAWAASEGILTFDGENDGLSFLPLLESEAENFDLSDPSELLNLFGEDPSTSAPTNVTLRVDPLLGLSVGGNFPSEGEWYQNDATVTDLTTPLGTLTFTTTSVTLTDFNSHPAALALDEGDEIDLGQNLWGTFVPSDPGDGSPTASYIGAVVSHFFPLDEDARPNQVDAISTVGTEVGIDATLAAGSVSISGSFAYSLASDFGGAFVVDALTGVVTVANTSALGTLAGSTVELTVRVTTAFGHRDGHFNVTISGDQTYNSIPGTNANDLLMGTSASDHLQGGAGDDTIDAAAGNDLIEGGAGSNLLTGGIGNDILVGGEDQDDLAGGEGDDVLAGNGGVNVIRFNLGDGRDLIRANAGGSSASATSTTIVFGSGIDSQDVTIGASADGKDLVVGVGVSGEQLVIEGLLDDAGGYGPMSFVFDDNTSWSIDEIAARGAVGGVAVGRIAVDGQANLLLGSAEADRLTGGTGGDLLASGAGDDVLDGGAGDDSMTGGEGNDTFIVDSAADAVIETVSGGYDTVHTNLATYGAPDNVESVIYTGSADFSVVGNALDNVLVGGAGDDHFAGGGGDDRYHVGQADDEVVELIDGGVDEVVTDLASFVLSDNVENLTYAGTGSTAFIGTGNASDNRITGGSGDDALAGGAGDDELVGGEGADLMTGGTGSDTYLVDHLGDVVIEASNEGRDTVVTTLTEYELGSDIEDLRYEGSADFSGDGNALDNVITSGGGNDSLYGGVGADQMTGGFGDDAYHVDNADDVVVEGGGAGVDLIVTSIDRILDANVENLQFVGTGTFVGTGNDLDNFILGGSDDDTLAGLGGDDLLDGSLGADSLAGGSGNDTYVVDDTGDVVVEAADEGIDTVQTSLGAYTLGANIENLLAEGSGNFEGTGNALDNILAGTAGTNILTGGAGNDRYWVLSDSTTVVEQAGEGIDEIVSYVGEWSLTANIENLTFDEGLAFAHGIGNGLNNILTGSVYGSRLEGLAGDDIYYVFRSDDEVVELADEGVDEVRLGDGSFFALSDHVEQLTYLGEENFTGVGNALDNVITGAAGDDVLVGGLGADTMAGKGGNDLYVVDDIGDTIVELADEGIDVVETTLNAYTLQANIEGVAFVGTGDFQGMGGAGDDRLVGGDGEDTLIGADGNDLLDGRAGADLLEGGNGDDTYVVDDASDLIVELADDGTDTVITSINYTLDGNLEKLRFTGSGNFSGIGNALDNEIVGGAGNDVLDGGAGADRLAGGFGDDVYYIDNIGDVVDELGRQGGDEVRTSLASFALTAAIENLTYLGSSDFTGTGNEADNIITGGIGDDHLSGDAGNDRLDGGEGVDTLVGGQGNDVYLVDDVGDLVTEATGGGRDTVYTSAAAYSLGANVEVLVYEGSSDFTGNGNGEDNEITSGVGNDVIVAGAGADRIITNEGDDTLYGDDGNDHLDAGAGEDEIHAGGGNDYLRAGDGTDTLYGGTGDDTYEIDFGDTVIEYAGEGTDTVVTSESRTLGAHFENLTLKNFGYASGTGNALDNIITGSYGDNGIWGMAGNDVLSGGSGYDTLVGGEGDDHLDGGALTDTAAFSGEMATYSIVTNGGSVTVVDNNATADGDDGTDTLVNIEYVYFSDGGVSLAAPLVLDLDGNGVSLTSIVNSNAVYDFDGDGAGSRTSWIGSGDGLLFYDRNGDGTVSGNELSFVNDRAGAKSDLEGLTAYDSNGDGVLSSGDDAFGRFGVWVDRNTDGKVDEREILALSQAGVASIGLSGEAVNRAWSFGDAVVVNNGSFTRTDGSKSAFADVVFTYGDDTLPFSSAARSRQSGSPSPHGIVHPDVRHEWKKEGPALWDGERWQGTHGVGMPWGIGARYGLQPIFEVPDLIVPIDTEFYSSSADGAIQSAASALVQSIAAFTPTVAAEAINERSEEHSRRDFWFAQGRPGNHMTPI